MPYDSSHKYPMDKPMKNDSYSKPMKKKSYSSPMKSSSIKVKLGGLTEHSSTGKGGFSERSEFNTRGMLAKK